MLCVVRGPTCSGAWWFTYAGCESRTSAVSFCQDKKEAEHAARMGQVCGCSPRWVLACDVPVRSYLRSKDGLYRVVVDVQTADGSVTVSARDLVTQRQHTSKHRQTEEVKVYFPSVGCCELIMVRGTTGLCRNLVRSTAHYEISIPHHMLGSIKRTPCVVSVLDFGDCFVLEAVSSV